MQRWNTQFTTHQNAIRRRTSALKGLVTRAPHAVRETSSPYHLWPQLQSMTRTSDSLREYLFVDKRRLDMYFEQLSSPVAYDKLPVWKFVLGLTGPRTEAAQLRPGRPFTHHEKVERLLRHLDSNNLVHRSRRLRHDLPFQIETMTASRAVIYLSYFIYSWSWALVNLFLFSLILFK